MKKLLLPLILLFVGTGGGVGAAMFLTSPAADETHADAASLEGCPVPDDLHAMPAAADEGHGDAAPVDGEEVAGPEYVRLNNQFVVPVVSGERVTALVILSVSVEVSPGTQDAVLLNEPKLRDAFLQILFDHANIGGFDGNFTSTRNMTQLRTALRNSARAAVGPDARDVLILDLVRQDVPG